MEVGRTIGRLIEVCPALAMASSTEYPDLDPELACRMERWTQSSVSNAGFLPKNFISPLVGDLQWGPFPGLPDLGLMQKGSPC